MTDTIVDAHHHIWRLDRTPWLSGPVVPRIFGDYRPLRRDYSIAEFAEDARKLGVVKSIYVQVNVAKGDEVEEVAWAGDQGAKENLVQGIVGFADLGDPKVADVLDAQCALPRLRGIRQQLHWHADSAYRFARDPDVVSQPAWRNGLMEVGKRGLVFELQVFPGQYPQTLRLVSSFPSQPFVLLHAGMPDDSSPDALAAWRAGLRDFAKHENVAVKLSGLGTFARRCDETAWRPIIRDTIDIFGPARCMFGSNFPIEKLWTSYAQLLDVFRKSISDLNTEEREFVLRRTAERVYRI